MWTPGMGELIILLVIVIMVFGAGKFPNVIRDSARSIREFRSAVEKDGGTKT